ncbi:MAG TPA: ATP-binding cassette domain-containing protein [Propionicimonas sp.]|jgi:ABC-type multidrug transport system ATPase subunit|uniref:ATP-binding cassette domain-containing protein n=1 Tax=Propionicimonas sp. TaxID=1955623 RepID=UPI002F3E72E5
MSSAVSSAHAVPATPEAGASPVLSASGIVKSYRSGPLPWRTRRVLNGADVTLNKGEVVGLVGENGSGKTTLMKILIGALAADAGAVARPDQVGYCPQEPVVYPRLTCNEHFELFGRAYGMRAGHERACRQEIYETLGFERYASVRADQLSGGTLSKLNLGLALLPDPDLLLLDEPYAGFDWDTYTKFWGLVEQRRSRGRAFLVISHFVVDEERFDRILEIREGRTYPR